MVDEDPHHRSDASRVNYSPPMTGTKDRLPQDPALRAIVHEARDALAVADPLGAAILTGGTAVLPGGTLEAQTEEARRLEGLAALLEARRGLAGEDELDREALLHSLRRVAPPPGPRAPAGSVVLERHLMLMLLGLSLEPEPRTERLAEVIEAAPAFLDASRQGCEGGPAAAGEVALAAAKRMPSILDLTAAAARALPLRPSLRERLEAGLGTLLTATAEDGGWILKQYMPSAVVGPERLAVEPSGLGMSLEELESAAEAMLADEAGLSFDEALLGVPDAGAAPPAFPPGVAPRDPAGLAVVADACRHVAAVCDAWCPEPTGVDFTVEAQPSWLQPLLPPVSLAPGGALSDEPVRLLVGDAAGGLSLQALEQELALVHAAEYLPVAAQRVEGRLARLLLPAAESLEGWRAVALSGAPGLAPRSRKELGWRAILTLVALGMAHGRLDVEEAGDLVAAETGMDHDTARLQALHVAAQPTAALTFIAGAVEVAGAVSRMERHGDTSAARTAVLAYAPLPGVSINRLGYTP
jgi:hypothetical protein